MGMTMTQKILAAHAGLDNVEAGQLAAIIMIAVWEICSLSTDDDVSSLLDLFQKSLFLFRFLLASCQ